MQFIRKHKSLKYTPGIVSILHTFGKGLKWHVHFHVLITAGGMKKQGLRWKWITNTYLNEEYLKKTYRAKMLSGLRKLYRRGKLNNARGKHPLQTFEQMLKEIYEKSWYVWIDEAKGDGIVAFQYIGRYCKRACISQKGIIQYDKGKLIAWKERKRKIETPDICAYRASPDEFLELLIQHIPDAYNHIVRYYGLYSSRNRKTLYLKACKAFKKNVFIEKVQSSINSGFNKLLSLMHGVEPLTCPICKNQLTLTGIIFFNPLIPKDRDILLNHEVKNYELVAKSPDTS